MMSMQQEVGAGKFKTAWVTGANKGIGYFIAKHLVHAGLRVFICCRSEERAAQALEQLVKDVPNPACPPNFLPFDLEDVNSFAKTKEAYTNICHQQKFIMEPSVDIMVHNAGFAFHGDATETTFEQAHKTTLINYFHTVQASQAFLPLMKEGGRLVFVTSQAGLLSKLSSQSLRDQFTSPTLSVDALDSLVKTYVNLTKKDPEHTAAGWPSTTYSASKLALNAYVRILARDPSVLARNLTVNACCPGWCATDMSSWEGPKSASDGADTPVWLSLADEVKNVTGKFFTERKEIPY